MQINFSDTIESALQSVAASANTSAEQLVIDLVTKHVTKCEIAQTRSKLRDLKASSGASTRGRSSDVLAVFEAQPQNTYRVADVTAAVAGSNAQYNGRVLTELCDAGKIKRVARGEYQLA